MSDLSGGRLFLVDAFTSVPMTGNPAAVLLLAGPPSDELCRRIGEELNKPATAVAWPAGEPGRFGLRWFTAASELTLCGHGTLAAARVLAGAGLGVDGVLRFDTVAGPLSATAGPDLVELTFPGLPPRPVGDAALTAAVRGVLGVPDGAPVEVLRNDLDLLAVLPGEHDVRAARPDLAALHELDTRGLIITAAGDGPDADFVSRFFAPAVGIPEDAVTGSAHCALAPLWIERLGRQPLLGRQVSARGGTVRVGLAGDRVRLGGAVVVLSEGTWLGGTAPAAVPAGSEPADGQHPDDG